MHEALFHGVPLVCAPHFGDQPQNAARVVAQGAGVLLPLAEISTARVAESVERASTDAYRANAARLGERLQAGGGLERALQILSEASRATS
jgi:UDP:flavonoid glycosyltransferase YjiC (YdhE family)